MTAALRRPHQEDYMAFYFFYMEKMEKMTPKKYTDKAYKEKRIALRG